MKQTIIVITLILLATLFSWQFRYLPTEIISATRGHLVFDRWSQCYLWTGTSAANPDKVCP